MCVQWRGIIRKDLLALSLSHVCVCVCTKTCILQDAQLCSLTFLQIISFSVTGTEGITLVGRMFQLSVSGDAVDRTRSDKIMVKMHLHFGLK